MANQLNLFQEAKPFSSPISGLSYHPNYISKQEADFLLAQIDAQIWLTDLKRRVQHYGYKYDYRARRIDTSMKIGALPEWLKGLTTRFYREGVFPNMPDQVIVNEYEAGQGISPHIDCEPCFEETIVSLSLNSVAVMDFSNDLTGEKIAVLLEAQSIVVLQGESRYDWKHGIAGRQKDVFEGVVYPRQRRVSLTFRTVIL
jgi:alkylated DNA repair dioxygenase AlkB